MTARTGRRMRELTDVQAAYLAGILDGEGYIAISRKKDPELRAGYGYRPVVSVSNTKMDLLVWLRDQTDLGSIREAFTAPKCARAWRWEVWSQQASQVVRCSLPFLVIKRGQAQLLLEFASVLVRMPGRDGLTDGERSGQIRIYDAMKTLNQKGVRDDTAAVRIS